MERVPVGSLLHKYQNYEWLLLKDTWKERLNTQATAFQILTVTEDQRHLGSILKRCSVHLKYPQLFLGTTHDLVEGNNILSSAI